MGESCRSLSLLSLTNGISSRSGSRTPRKYTGGSLISEERSHGVAKVRTNYRGSDSWGKVYGVVEMHENEWGNGYGIDAELRRS